ncbi:MAG: glycosyltransferase family 4 protein [Acidobacteria bacterium]|nr:glycosyltransferase family 4 protein [Acidobacteriota bacterium]
MSLGRPLRRVAMIASEYPPYVCGGLGRHVEAVTRELSKRLAVSLLVPAMPAYREPPPGLTLVPVGVPKASSHETYWDEFGRLAAGAIGSLRPSADVVHAHDWMAARPGIAASSELGVPLVMNVHLPQQADPGRCREAEGLAKAAAVIVNSASVLDELAERGADRGRIHVIPNGVDGTVFRPAADWPADDGSLLFVGRLVPQKGADVLLRAHAALLARDPETRLDIVGDGESELYLRRLTHYLGTSPAVRFAGWAQGDDLVAAFQRAAVVAIPSRYEPFGIVALEAMACGRPVVASAVGGLAEVVSTRIGALVPAEDHLSLAAALARLLADPAAREAAGRGAVEAAAGYNWSRIAERTLDVYEQALEIGGYP